MSKTSPTLHSYIRTDLAAEVAAPQTTLTGVRCQETQHEGITVTETIIETEDAGKALGKRPGRYVMLDAPAPWMAEQSEQEALCTLLRSHLVAFCKEMANEAKTVLCVGLGNREITPDALGPLTVSKLTVTRHLQTHRPDLFSTIGTLSLSAISPGVIGQTGIETLEQIQSAVSLVKPDLLIVIDALAARNADRLASSIQLTDTGIQPGSGVGNRRQGITKESVGVPVLVIGVPTIVDSSTLIYDTLERAGMTEETLTNALKETLENARSFFVTLKDSDSAVSYLSSLLAQAINGCFFPNG